MFYSMKTADLDAHIARLEVEQHNARERLENSPFRMGPQRRAELGAIRADLMAAHEARAEREADPQNRFEILTGSTD